MGRFLAEGGGEGRHTSHNNYMHVGVRPIVDNTGGGGGLGGAKRGGGVRGGGGREGGGRGGGARENSMNSNRQ